jgi:hypothetical protein
MTITETLYQSNTQLNRAFGAHKDTAESPAAKTISVGFMPRRVRWLDETTLDSWEWISGMANGTTLKTDGTTQARTLNTANAAISIVRDGTQGSLLADSYKPAMEKGSYAITIAAAAIAASSQCRFEVFE